METVKRRYDNEPISDKERAIYERYVREDGTLNLEAIEADGKVVIVNMPTPDYANATIQASALADWITDTIALMDGANWKAIHAQDAVKGVLINLQRWLVEQVAQGE